MRIIVFSHKILLTKFLKANFNFIFSGKLRTFRQEINTHLEKHSHAHTYTYIYTLIKYFIDLLCFTVVVVVVYTLLIWIRVFGDNALTNGRRSLIIKQKTEKDTQIYMYV